MLSHTTERSVRSQLLAHFGLRENPFGVTPDPRFLFLTETHGEALASLVNGIDCDFGFQVLVAQPGMGKTTLLFNFLERFRTTAHTAFLFQPQSNPCELLQSVLLELGITSAETSLRKLSEQLNQVLTRAARERRRVIVVLDEAQNLDFAVLEALRQLSNFETASAKLMQIVLAGQPQLAKRLALPEQEQLMQRISAFARLRPLALHETTTYIEHRLGTAGYQGSLFTPEAVRAIWDRSRGVPRNINTLCFNAMMLGFAELVKSLDERIVEEAARDLDLNSVLSDAYQMDPSEARAGSIGKLQPMVESGPAKTDGARRIFPEPAAIPVRISKDAGVPASAAHSGNGNLPGAAQGLPAAPVDSRGQIGRTQEQALEKPKMAPAAKWAPPADTPAAPPRPAAGATAFDIQAAASQAQANSGKTSPAASTLIQNSSANTFTDKQTTYPGKHFPVKTFEEPAQPERAAALAVAPLRQKTVEKKRAESRIWWAQAVALTAAIGILAFVLLEEFSGPRPGNVEAHGSSGSTPAQDVYGAPNDGPIDAAGAPLKNTSRGRSNPDTNDHAGVRNFPADADPGSASAGKGQRLATIFFAQDSVMIGSQYGPFLQRVADALAQNPGASVILEGHTDDSGPESYNLDLSSRRAIAVRNALVDELHLPSTRLAAVGAGATAPVQPNSSPEGRAYNRRVEIRLAHVSD